MADDSTISGQVANLQTLYLRHPLDDPQKQIRFLTFERWEHDDDEITCSFGTSSVAFGDEEFTYAAPDTSSDDPGNVASIHAAPEESVDDFGNEKFSYAAISYTWGDPTELRSIVIDGLMVTVRANCWYALCQVRNLRSGERIWIDFICINQDDVEEKSIQVSIMHEIFASASNVYACIGPHADDSEHFMRSAAEFDNLRRQEDYNDGKLWKYGRKWLRKLSPADFDFLQSVAAALLNRRYWTRVWVVQEIILASRAWILVGNDVIDWLRLCQFSRAVNEHYTRDRYPGSFEHLEIEDTIVTAAWQQIAEFNPGPASMLTALSHDLNSFDPRDRIYALRKLIKWPPLAGDIYPDYSKSPFQVAREMLKYFEAEERRLGKCSYPIWDGLFSFATQLILVLGITLEDIELQDMIHARHVGCTSNFVKTRSILGLPHNRSTNYVLTNGPRFNDWRFGPKKAVSGREHHHRAVFLTANATLGDVAVDLTRDGRILVLRSCEDFFEIVGIGISTFCSNPRNCDCYNDAVHIMDTKDAEFELAIDEADLWAFALRDWEVIERQVSASADGKMDYTGQLDDFCANRFSSIAIRPTASSEELMNGDGDGFRHWL